MKNIVAGGILLMSGIFLYIGVHVAAAIHMKEIIAWDNPTGKYGTALSETGSNTPLTFSILLCVFGLLILLWGAFSEVLSPLINQLLNDIKNNNKGMS